MPPRRKPTAKPRENKRLAHKGPLHVLEVGPWGTYWRIRYDGRKLGSVFRKADALTIVDLVGDLAVCCGESVSIRVKDQWGRHQTEWTHPRSADPSSPG
jgi:hypothetical protein